MAALEAQRSILGDSVVDLALDALRHRLAALEAAEQHTQQRKQATILFADVSGFTAVPNYRRRGNGDGYERPLATGRPGHR